MVTLNRDAHPSERAAIDLYASIPEHIREDLVAACKWAENQLAAKDGPGHVMQITYYPPDQVCCSFAKPEWAGDHCGSGMSDGAAAVVMAVCEYMCGM